MTREADKCVRARTDRAGQGGVWTDSTHNTFNNGTRTCFTASYRYRACANQSIIDNNAVLYRYRLSSLCYGWREKLYCSHGSFASHFPIISNDAAGFICGTM